MAGSAAAQFFSCPIIIARSGGSEILVRTDTDSSLPFLDLSRTDRPSKQLAVGIEKNYGLEAYCLWIGDHSMAQGDATSSNYAVMEVLSENNLAPSGLRWVSAEHAARNTSPSDSAVARFLVDLRRYAQDPAAPFAKPGWIKGLFTWVREQLHPLRLRPTGGIWQVNAGPAFSLIRLQTSRAPVWFKATGEPHTSELSISLALAGIIPDFVPHILGVHSAWNGWLSMDVPGRSLADSIDHHAWEKTAQGLALLQVATLDKKAELGDAKILELGNNYLARRIAPFTECAAEWMRAQQVPSPAPLAADELAFLGGQLAESCERLQRRDAPESVGRFDLSPGNIVVSHDGVVFLDWAEAYWGHPFLSFAYLLEHFRRSHPDAAFEGALETAYRTPWREVCSDQMISETLASARLVAALAYTVTSRAWQDRENFQNPRTGAYLRSMARRMHREAKHLAERSGACLS